MAYNRELLKERLSDIKFETFKEALFLSYKGGITSVAPLGFSGDDILLFGDPNGAEVEGKDWKTRKSIVSMRNYGGNTEMLITDIKGSFLFYGRLHIELGVEFVVGYYWRIFCSVYHKIETKLPKVSEFSKIEIPDNCPRTEGFAMLEAYQRFYK